MSGSKAQIAFAAMLIGSVLASIGRAAEPPNILFILSDNQSFYEMSCHGHEVLETPAIDQLASESVEFLKFYAPPFCSPSRAAILTGRYAMRSGVHDTIGGRSILHRDEITLADRLRASGYRTSIFGKWHLGFSYPYRPQDRGFDEVFVHGGGGIGQLEDYYGNTHYGATFLQQDTPTTTTRFSTDELFSRAMTWMELSSSKPFFCFLSLPVTHSPHHGPEDLEQQFTEAGHKKEAGLYAQVTNLDQNIGRAVTFLKDSGLLENTIVIYGSDQGMNDRGSPQGGLRQGLAFDPAHHVPMMIRVPGVEPQRSEQLSGMIDLCPTILEFAGVDSPNTLDGLSLAPLFSDLPNDLADRMLIIQCPRGREAKKWRNASVKTDRWRLVEGERLFDALRDPRQQNDIAAQHPEVVATLREAYEKFWQDLPSQESTLSRHLLGSAKCPKVVLNGMDWYRGDRPWHKGHFDQAGNGAWAVEVVEPGTYVISCYRYPREAQKAAGASRAELQIGNAKWQQDIAPNAEYAEFKIELEKGEFDLSASLTIGDKDRGALFVYVERVSAP